MKEYFTIGEVSKLFQTNVRTLRYYDRIGLLKPARVDPQTGYRYYSTKDFERLNTIKYLRTLHVPLEKIDHFFNSKDLFTIQELLEEQLEQITQQQEQLHRIRLKLDSRLAQLADITSEKPNQIRIKKFPLRPAALLRQEISITDDLELPIRELERLHHLEPIMFLGKVGVSISSTDLINGCFSSFSSIFVLIEPADSGPEEQFVIPEGPFLTLRFQGTHSGAEPHYHKLMNFARTNHLQVIGDSVEITLIDSGLTSDQNQFITEIQIPVQSIHSSE